MSRSSSPTARSVRPRSRASVFVLLGLVIVWGAATTAQSPLTFATGVGYPTNSSFNMPFTQAVGDFNNDGLPDVVVADGSGPTVLRLFLGSGGGALSGPINVSGSGPCPGSSCAGSTNWVRAADLNADGNDNIITSNNHSRNLSVILSNGDGTFQAASQYAMGWDTRAVAVGDLNNDGKLDLVGGDSNSDIRVFIGNGDGTFGPGVSQPEGGINRQSMVVADLDNDGNNDLLVGNRDSTPNNISVLRGHGDGTLTPWAFYGSGLARGESLIVEDFNEDGWLDVAAPSHSFVDVIVFLGTGGGNLGAPTAYPNPNGGTLQLASGDINGDGHADIVASNQNAHTVSILQGDGAGGFGTATVIPSPANTSLIHGAGQPATADFDADGRTDISVVAFNNDKLVVFLNRTLPSDSTPPVITPSITGTLGGDGWYTDDVTVSWSVSDPESTFTSSGCETQSVTSDTSGTTFTCTATSLGGASSDSVTIKRDASAPVVASATANPSVLWPPNNKMVAVTVSVDASDAGSGLAGCSITSVSSNEGGSAHEPDVELTGDLTMTLRAERHGGGSGRIYTAQISCTDAAGNASAGSATVTVPHDQRKR